MCAPFPPGRFTETPLPPASHLLRLIIAFAAAAVPWAARADIVWAQQRVVLEPPAGAQEIAADFTFTNRGNQPVRITDVQSGCGCTVAVVDEKTVAPGGVGHIRATYQAAQKQGKQSVALTVTTAEPESRTHALQLEVRLKDYAAISPVAHSWRIGEEVSPFVFTLKLASGFAFVGAETTNPDFLVEVIERSTDAVRLKVAPRDLWARRTGIVKARVAQAGRAPVEVSALLVVQ